MRTKQARFVLLLAIGFEFIGLVLGGSFMGHVVGKVLKLQEGVGEALGTLLGLIVALLVTYRILRLSQRVK